jgi:hypothetical protein
MMAVRRGRAVARLICHDPKDRFRRFPGVVGHPGEGLFTIRFADLRPGEPPEGQLDGREGQEGGQGFGKVLEILGEMPVSSNQEKVRWSVAPWFSSVVRNDFLDPFGLVDLAPQPSSAVMRRRIQREPA